VVDGSRRHGKRAVARRLLVLLPVLALFAAGCTGPDESTATVGPVTIGLMTPVTGAQAAWGVEALRGAQLAVEVVNESYPDLPIPLAMGSGLPGLGGRRLALAGGDTKGTADDAVNEAGLLVGNGAVALVSADSAEVAAAIGSQTQRLHVPLVDAGSTADYLTELGMDWYFRTLPSDRLLAETAFALLQSQFANSATPRVAILAESGAQDAAATTLVSDLAQRAGYTVATQATVSNRAGAADQAAQLDLADADVLLALVTSRQGAADIAQVASRLEDPLPLIGLGPGFEAVPLDPVQFPAVLRTSSWSAELSHRNPAGKALADLYLSRFGATMTEAAANAFTATLTVAAAIDASGSSDPAAIRSALRQIFEPATHLIMPWSGVRFDANGQNLLAAGVVEGRQGGNFGVVFPRELAIGPMIWSQPKGTTS
jgi:branched-chain amino acid transport system substrate-binding protein